MNLALHNLPSMLLGYIRGQIISGELAGGQKINENEFAARLELSRGPLREAFRVLEQERLVVNLPRKGTFVTALSQADLAEVYQVRRMIEVTALDLLQQKRVTDLPSAARALREAKGLKIPKERDREEFLVFREKITDFHARLVMEANNARLTHYYETLYFSLARYQYLHIKLNVPQGYERPTETHHLILTLISASRHQDAKLVLLDHLQDAHRTQEEALVRSLSATGPGPCVKAPRAQKSPLTGGPASDPD